MSFSALIEHISFVQKYSGKSEQQKN